MLQPVLPIKLKRRLLVQIIITLVLLVIISVSAYQAHNRSSEQSAYLDSFTDGLREIQRIPLTGEITSKDSEISGMAWFGDTLILVPQYPHRLSKNEDGKLFGISKTDILTFLDGTDKGPLEPKLIPINSQIYKNQIKGFEGFEAIAFNGNRVYLTIEASEPMRAYLATGMVDPDLQFIQVDPEVIEISSQAKIDNFSDEAIIIYQDKLITFYEANGVNDNPQPVAHMFNLDLEPLGTIPMPNIEYRLTDASVPNAGGYFWVINYFFVGDLIKIRPGVDSLIPGNTSTINFSQPVERLVELKVFERGIVMGDQSPIRLSLAENGAARNWEALAALDERGFLIATDEYPETILAFISR